MKDKILNYTQAELPLSSNCQVEDSSNLYYKQEFNDLYKIQVVVNLTADDDVDAHVYSLIDDIKVLIHNRQNVPSINYEPIKNVEITRIQNSVVINKWSEQVRGDYPSYLDAPKSLQNGRREQFVGTMEGNTREREGEVSMEGEGRNNINS